MLNLGGISLNTFFVPQQFIDAHWSFLEVHFSTLPWYYGDIFVTFKDSELVQDLGSFKFYRLNLLFELNISLLLLSELIFHVLINNVCDITIVCSAQIGLEVAYKLNLLDELVI